MGASNPRPTTKVILYQTPAHSYERSDSHDLGEQPLQEESESYDGFK
jgi:hypothetical protein